MLNQRHLESIGLLLEAMASRPFIACATVPESAESVEKTLALALLALLLTLLLTLLTLLTSIRVSSSRAIAIVGTLTAITTLAAVATLSAGSTTSDRELGAVVLRSSSKGGRLAKSRRGYREDGTY